MPSAPKSSQGCCQMLVGCGEGFGEGAGTEVLGEIGVSGLGLEFDGGEREGEEHQGEAMPR